jgi:predicted AlkP superfamily phosphohydrolase/phosphomutase
LLGEPYETVGWACLSNPYKDKEIDEATFLEAIEFTFGWREKLTLASLARGDWRLFMSVESTPDRVQHMLYQHYDPEHPLHDAAKAASTIEYFGETIPLSDVIPATYRQVDRFVGRVMDEHLRPEDTLIVCADHGFQSFRRQVHLNNWLEREGYLELKPGVTSRDRDFLGFVDWSKTRAYSLGLGAIYLNQRGREALGTVEPGERDALLAEIKDRLLREQDDGTPAVVEVHRTSDIHSGPFLEREADLMVGFARGYRVSWSTTTGGMRLRKNDQEVWEPGPVCEDNTSPWSGDHVSVASPLVQGIFFSSRPVVVPEGGLDLLHIAPTALSLLGVALPDEYDLPPLAMR